MERTGNLSEFPLADILQILGVSRKTGTIILRNEEGKRGMLVLIDGKIVQAATDAESYSLGESLVAEGMITKENLEDALTAQAGMEKPRLLGSILVERGAIKREALFPAIKHHIQKALKELLGWDRGDYEVKLNAIPVGRGIPYITQDFVYSGGLNIEELLSEAGKLVYEAQLIEKERDDGVNDIEPVAESSEEAGNAVLDEFRNYLEPDLPKEAAYEADSRRIIHLKSLLEEMKNYSFQGEISLLIMRSASEVCSRGVLFLIKEKEAAGLGQFGFSAEGIAPDKWVRGISIPLGVPSILDRVVNTGKTQVAAVDPTSRDMEILSKIGGENLNLTAFGIPMIFDEKVRVILYGDNYPGERELGDLDELEILMSQAGLMMDKILLERQLQELKRK